MKIASFFFVWAFIIAALTGNTVYAQAPPYAGALSGGSGGGVPAAAASLNLANYLTSTQLTTAQAGINTQDLTTQIAAWIAACPATGCQYVIPPGYFYTATCNFNITNAFSMVGAGTRGLTGTTFISVIACGSTSARLFNVSSKTGYFTSLAMVQVGGTAVAGSSAAWICTLGASSDCTTSIGTDFNPSVGFSNIMVDGFYDSWDSGINQSWKGTGSTIQNCVHWCFRIRNTVNADAGDWAIAQNNIYPAGGADAGVRYESSGNGHIEDNQFVQNTAGSYNSCVSISVNPAAPPNGSAQIFIQNNKCEQTIGPAYAVYGGWSGMLIDGNMARLKSTTNGSFVGSIGAGTNVLTVTGSVVNQISVGQIITGVGVPKGTYVTAYTGGGTPGQTGTYSLNVSSAIATLSETMTNTSPAILCVACQNLEISSNTFYNPGTPSAAAILLVATAGATVGSSTIDTVTGATGFSSQLMLSQSRLVSFSGANSWSLANLPDPSQLAPGSTSFVTDAVTPVAGQPFTGGGKIPVAVYSDGGRWLAAATILASNYLGPGDVKSGAFAWWGLQAYSAAKVGTRAANVCNISVGDGSCTDINTLANGQLDLVAAAAIPCTGAADCNIKILYDQTVAGNCTGSCDLVMAGGSVAGQRPILLFNRGNLVTASCNNAINGMGNQACMLSSRPAVTQMVTAGAATLAQPYTLVGVGARYFNPTFYSTFFANTAGTAGLYYGASANNADLVATTDHLFPAADQQWHAVIAVGNGATPNSFGAVDGVVTNLSTTAAFATAQTLKGFSDAASPGAIGANFQGVIAEMGIWGSAFSAGDTTNMTNNIRARNGF